MRQYALAGSALQKQVYSGGCHCTNIQVEFATKKPVCDLWVRKCPCAFCVKQGNFNVTDPEGLFTVVIHDQQKLVWYQMGHKTSRRLICAICGVYIGGFMEHDQGNICVFNLNTLDDRSGFSDPSAIDVITQTPIERIEGRLKRWMPYKLINFQRS